MKGLVAGTIAGQAFLVRPALFTVIDFQFFLLDSLLLALFGDVPDVENYSQSRFGSLSEIAEPWLDVLMI